MNIGAHAALRLGLLSVGTVLTAGVGLAAGSQYNVVYEFHGGQDGYYPAAPMIASPAGVLYGTTFYGGGSAACEGQELGCGTVFSLTPPATSGAPWTENVLYRFQGGSDGAYPQGALTFDSEGNLYGVTASGGSANCTGGCGTVFELVRPATPEGTWTENLLYEFQGVPSGKGNGDAAGPNGLVLAQGDLFGMASGGGYCVTSETGTSCYGAIFKLKPAGSGAWTESILYRFVGPTGAPTGPTFDKSGNLYGSAGWGKYGYGLIFRLERLFAAGDSPVFEQVYNFQGGSDGAFPNAGLTFDSAGNLYGSTFGGGPANYGTVFELTPPSQSGTAWTESQLYAFTSAAGDANTPNGGLVFDGSGDLWGSAQAGGQSGDGAVFELTRTAGSPWPETVAHSFSFSDGALPGAGLTTGRSGNLFGTTEGGGSNGTDECYAFGTASHCGVIFEYVP
jgi:uncharacterized repeat protein (TIGR03803 family)